MQCYLCGTESARVSEARVVQLGARRVEVDDEFYRCPHCGEEFYESGMGDQTLRRAAARVREEDGLLTPDEIVAIRHQHGLTQAQLEKLMPTGEKTVVRWERGTVCQGKTADTLLRVLRDHPEVAAGLMRERDVPTRARAPKRASRRASPRECTSARVGADADEG